MDKAKIRLSPKEAELVLNADWILTKNEILEKVKWILADLQARQHHFMADNPPFLPSEVTIIPAKISRGENYKGLPYLILDYPRYFGKEDHFAIRSMFWWGNFFSITLHLTGVYKKIYEPGIAASFERLKNESFFIGISNDQWEHHFESGNYLPLTEISEAKFKNHVSAREFIKLAKKIPLDQWNEAEDILFDSFCKMIAWLKG